MYKNMFELIAPYAKALVPLGVSIILTGFAALGIGPEMTVEQAVTLLITSILVYFVPNKK